MEQPLHRPLSGIIVIDKPAGWTSHDVVGRLRRLLNERRIGHAGTLDPAATGVLPVAVGQATRVIEFLEHATKSYVAEITFGVETDSQDADGRVTAIDDPSGVDRRAVGQALAQWLGPQWQTPPMYSAVKIGGRRLYAAARQGIEIERPARRVEFFALDLIDWRPPTATIFVDCSKGTYIRTLAFDVGKALGPGAFLSNLVRVRSGPFRLCDAWTLSELAELSEDSRDVLESSWPSIAHHPDSALLDHPAIVLNEWEATSLTQGRDVSDGNDASEARLDSPTARAYDVEGRWLGVAHRHGNNVGWRPLKICS